MLKPMASSLTFLAILQLVAVICCVASADFKAADKTEDDKVKITAADNTDEDLETQETGWMVDPIQMKLKELQYIKSKVFTPFMTLKAPSQFYGGGYPIYSSCGGSSFSSGLSHHTSFSGPSWGKPVKTFGPMYSQSNWYNKGPSGIKYQPAAHTYAPDCDYTTTNKPSSVFVPATPTYSPGTPLNVYYSSMAPTQTYGTPSFGFSTKSSFSTSGQVASSPPALQAMSVPAVTSTAFLAKASPQYSFFGYQPTSSFASWPGASGSFPTSQTFQPSWFGASGYYPSTASLPQTPSSPSFSGVSGYYPTSGSLPQAPGSSSFPGMSVYYPSSSGVPQTPSISSQPSWSSVASSFPSSSQIPQAPSWSSFSGSAQAMPSPVPVAQQYFVVPPSTPAPQTHSDQGVSIPSEEVSITPPPVGVKSSIVNNLQGPNVALTQEQIPYNPSSAYAVSFYPNVFYISNEQRIDKPSTEMPDEGRSSLVSTTNVPVPALSESSSTATSTESSPVSTPTTPTTITSPVQTNFYSSNNVDQSKIPVAYSFQKPIFPTTRGGFYSSPVQPNFYPVPVSSVGGTASWGISQPQIVQTLPFTRSSSISSYPVSLGYNYQQPPVNFQSGLQVLTSTKSSPPC